MHQGRGWLAPQPNPFATRSSPTLPHRNRRFASSHGRRRLQPRFCDRLTPSNHEVALLDSSQQVPSALVTPAADEHSGWGAAILSPGICSAGKSLLRHHRNKRAMSTHRSTMHSTQLHFQPYPLFTHSLVFTLLPRLPACLPSLAGRLFSAQTL